MIAIVNIDKTPRPCGSHEYELRINNEVIARFTHNREEGLAKCLHLAAVAAEMAKVKRIDDYLELFNI